jgi:hypothetical protein
MLRHPIGVELGGIVGGRAPRQSQDGGQYQKSTHDFLRILHSAKPAGSALT